jgi:hypothetical protein
MAPVLRHIKPALILLCLCLVGVESSVSAKEKSERSDTEYPVFYIGKEFKTNYLIFIWSSDSVESANAYQNIVRTLAPEITSGQLRVVALQLDTGSRHDNDTGPLFLCAAKDSFPALAMEYLKHFDGKFTQMDKWQIADALLAIGPKNGLPSDVLSCQKGVEAQARRKRFAETASAIKSVFGVSSAPAFFFNRTQIFPSSPADIRTLISKANQR